MIEIPSETTKINSLSNEEIEYSIEILSRDAAVRSLNNRKLRNLKKAEWILKSNMSSTSNQDLT